MAKRQSRRSISVKGTTYLRLKAYCATMSPDNGQNDVDGHASVSGYLERLIAADLDAKGVPTPTSAPLRAPKPKPEEPIDPDKIVSQHFTF